MAQAFLSASWHRVAALKPRLKPHLRIRRQQTRGQGWYVVYDPATGQTHRFTPGAYLFIGRLDGTRSIDAAWQDVVARLGDGAPTQDDVVGLLAQLHAADLLRGDAAPDTGELFERHRKQWRQSLRSNVLNPFSWRVPLWNPDRFLAFTLPAVRWAVGPLGLVLWLAVVGLAAIQAGIHWRELTENIQDRVLATQNLFLMAATYVLVKSLHELGHGYVAKAHGGLVPEMGVMLLVLFPVPYVDASSASVFRSKWQRAAVGAAGIMVELFLAALAMFAWLHLEPGFWRAFAFNVMLIGGVSTLIFNGNPLLRFDGYYVLADLIEIPNLALRGIRYWGHLVERYAFATTEMRDFPASRGERIWFLVYAPAAFAYRMVVLFGIVVFIAGQFFFFGVAAAIWGVASGLLWPIGKRLWHVATSPKLRRVRRRAVAVTLGAVATIAGLIGLVPLPARTLAEGIVWLPEDSYVRAGADGFVRRVLVTPGAAVARGDALIESEDPTLATRLAALEWKVAEAQAQHLGDQVSDRSAARVSAVALQHEQAGLAREQARAGRLVSRTERGGRFALVRPAEDLPGRFVKEGEILGYVVPETTSRARVIVAQDDIELVRGRLTGLELRFRERLEETHRSAILRELPAARDELPNAGLAVSPNAQTMVDPRDPKGLKTLQRVFQVDVELPAAIPGIAFGQRVHVRFEHDWEPIGAQIWRRLRQLLLRQFHA